MRLVLHRGGQARTVNRWEARKRVNRETHNLVLVTQGDRTTAEVAEIAAKAGRWWSHLRAGDQRVYGALLRFIDIAIALGADRDTLMMIPALIASYIDDMLPSPSPQSRPALRLMTGEYEKAA